MQIQNEFEYQTYDSSEHIDIQVKFVRKIESKFQIFLSEYKTSLKVVYGSDVLVICGKLNSQVTGITNEKYEDNIFSFRLLKKDAKSWNILIISRHEETQEIDYQSSYLIYRFMNDYGFNYEESIDWLKYSSLGYLPGIRELSTYYFSKDEREKGIELLKFGVEKFRDPKCMYNLGLIYLNDSELRLRGFQLLKLASELKYGPSYRIIGQLYSPLSDKEFSNKNGFQALKYLDLAVNYQPNDAVSLYEMAKLIYKGIGTKKSIKHASMLEKRAIELDNTIKPLKVYFKENKDSINWGKHVTIISITLISFSLIYYFRKRKIN